MSMRAGLLVCAAMLVALGLGFAGGVIVGSKRATLAVTLPGFGGGAKASDLCAEIAAHPFWRVKVTAAQVEELVAKIRAEKRDTVVFVDDQFVEGMNREPASVHDQLMRRSVIKNLGTGAIARAPTGPRFVSLDLVELFPAQPTAEEVAVALLAAIRVREYRD